MELQKTESADLERRIIKEISFPLYMSRELMDQWADGIPVFSEADPKKPEWKETPLIPLDLSRIGYGELFIKNEADRSCNPTGTIKDRAAWELATLYRDYARGLYLKLRAGNLTKGELQRLVIPRFSLITAGNEGLAIANCFQQYKLPPPKMIVGTELTGKRVDSLSKLRADIYQLDLTERELSADDIKRMTNNPSGIDITSCHSIEPQAIFYDWHVHESFNQSPDVVIVPRGSGRLMENYLYWQHRTLRNNMIGTSDPRLRVPTQQVINIDILGAEPDQRESIADKLTTSFRPFVIFNDQDIESFRLLASSGDHTGIHKVSEERIMEALAILRRHGISAEASAAVSLGLYLALFERSKIPKGQKVLVVNTGRGLEM